MYTNGYIQIKTNTPFKCIYELTRLIVHVFMMKGTIFKGLNFKREIINRVAAPLLRAFFTEGKEFYVILMIFHIILVEAFS